MPCNKNDLTINNNFTNRSRVSSAKGKLQISLIFLNTMISQKVHYLIIFIIHINDYSLAIYRPSSGEILAHCLFWPPKKQLEFFNEVRKWIEQARKKQPPESTIVDNLEVGVKNVFKDKWPWIDSIDEELKQGMTICYHLTISCYS